MLARRPVPSQAKQLFGAGGAGEPADGVAGQAQRGGEVACVLASAWSWRRDVASAKSMITPMVRLADPYRCSAPPTIESLNYQLRKVTKARGHFPGDAVVKLLWLAIINIEDKRARERAARKAEPGKRHDQPARLIEGQRAMCWREALNELAIAYPG